MDLKMAESHLSLKMLYRSVAGVMVSIAAFQAVDPGSIPGPRIVFFVLCSFPQKTNTKKKPNSNNKIITKWNEKPLK